MAASKEPRAELIGWGVLAGLLGVLAIRMTLTETVRTTLSMLLAERSPGSVLLPPTGPATTLGLCVVTLLLAGVAAWVRPMTKGAWGTLAVIVAIGICLAVSTVRAEARFAALVGSADALMALLGGWALSLVAGGPKARRIVVAVLVAILTAWAARAIVQYLVDFPEMLEYYKKNTEQVLRDQGIAPGSPEEDQYRHRLMSQEVSGFITFSNVFANGLVGLCTVGAGLVAAGVVFKRAEQLPAAAEQKRKKRPGPEVPRGAERAQIPIWPVALGGVAVVLAAGVLALVLTASKGAGAATALCGAALVAGMAGREFVSRHRWKLVALLAVLAMGAAASVVWYGMRHDRLPTKSLMFRWHYWTGAAPLIGERPLAGVGMNNFGDYYTAVKRPSSPEDVKDPHSFFVRWAAEAGLPAAGLVGGLIVMYVVATVRRRPEDEAGGDEPIGGLVIAGAVFCAAWFAVSFVLSEKQTEYDAIMSAIYATVAWGGFMAAAAGQRELSQGAGRVLAMVLLLGALGMLIYDQVNMALVTGPVAMLFWMMLGTAGANEKAGRRGVGGKIAGATLAAGAAALAVLVWGPVMRKTLAWDPHPAEERYVDAVLSGDTAGALKAMDRALELTPRSIGCLRARIEMRRRLGLPVAEDIRRAMNLDQTNARVRMELAMQDSDLPAAERAAMLEKALVLDAALPRDEAKILDQERIAAARAKIGELRGR